jgi:hypothetical protein
MWATDSRESRIGRIRPEHRHSNHRETRLDALASLDPLDQLLLDLTLLPMRWHI